VAGNKRISMIKFFRKIRQNMIKENKVFKYVLYAVGEIVLVVIGILIALTINNNNEANKKRATELHYLTNIKNDLNLTIASLDEYINTREAQIASAKIVLAHHYGKPITNYTAFNMHCISIYIWSRYNPSDNTFQELVNSGNLALISNDALKNLLLNLQSEYKALRDGEDHFRYDAEQLLYKPVYSKLDMDPTTQNFMYQVTGGQEGEDVFLDEDDFKEIVNSLEHKNGMSMAVYEFGQMVLHYKEMKRMAEELILLINKEQASD
jgi:uncharacterized protein DUF6090